MRSMVMVFCGVASFLLGTIAMYTFDLVDEVKQSLFGYSGRGLIDAVGVVTLAAPTAFLIAALVFALSRDDKPSPSVPVQSLYKEPNQG